MLCKDSNGTLPFVHFLLADGELFIWGSNSSGQLGLGKSNIPFPFSFHSLWLIESSIFWVFSSFDFHLAHTHLFRVVSYLGLNNKLFNLFTRGSLVFSVYEHIFTAFSSIRLNNHYYRNNLYSRSTSPIIGSILSKAYLPSVKGIL